MPNKRTKSCHILHVIAFLQTNKLYKGRTYQLEATLKKVIGDSVDRNNVSKIIENLIKDGVIIADSKDSGTLRIANDDEIKKHNQDLYCFECFLPGDLVKCRNCTRVFHISCARRRPDRPNYVIPKSNEIAEFEDDETDSTRTIHFNTSTETVRIKPCRVILQRTRIVSVNSNEINESSIEQQASDEKPEVVCLGELRPPTRQRNITEGNSMKCESDADESLNSDQTNGEKELCTFCRLIKAGQILQPPGLDAAEMCHLLKYTFKRNRDWIKHDIYKQPEIMKLSNKSLSLLSLNLFPNRRMMTLEAVEEKINLNQYNLLNEFLADIIEFQYALGVLFSSDHVDFDCSKYFVRDIQYDIQEIRRCPDCFRHSSDRITPYWFALPCVQRHELVFAKCKGHDFWPAKVVRVLRKAYKYDVRFFGGNHERAVVDKTYIRPIDAADLRKPKSAAFKKAMNELLCYQALEGYSMNKFSFHSANKNEIENIIKTVMSAIDGKFNLTVEDRISKRRKTISVSQIRDVDIAQRFSTYMFEENISNFDGSSSEPRTPTPKNRREPSKIVTVPVKRLRRGEEYNTTNSSAIPTLEVPTSTTANLLTMSKTENEIALLRLQCENLKRQIELHDHELLIAKRKSYCFICLKPAEFICCINASYCSKKCQRQHWIDGHKTVCSHRSTN